MKPPPCVTVLRAQCPFHLEISIEASSFVGHKLRFIGSHGTLAFSKVISAIDCKSVPPSSHSNAGLAAAASQSSFGRRAHPLASCRQHAQNVRVVRATHAT